MNTLKLTCGLPIMIFIFSCGDDFLAEEHPTEATGAASIGSPDQARLAANGLYQAIFDAEDGGGAGEEPGLDGLYGHDEPSLWYFDEMRGDDVSVDLGYLDRRADRCVKYYGLTYGDEEPAIEELWNSLYRNIYHCNWVIESVEGNAALSQEIQDEVLSQAYFMRGFYHFTLVRLWGDVPLMRSVPQDREEFTPAKEQASLVWDAALDDMEFAATITNLPPEIADANGDVNKGYATEAVIHAIAARAYLYRPATDKTSDFESVIRHAEAVINLGVYELEADYEDLFSTDGDIQQTQNTEVIWHAGAASTASLDGTFLDINNRLSLRSAPPGISVTRAFVSTTNQFTSSRPGRAIWASSPEIASMMQDAFEDDNDIRIVETFYYPEYRNYTNAADNVFRTFDAEADLTDWLNDRNTGAPTYFRKFRYPGTTVSEAQELIYNSVTPSIIRYADVLLMHAEASARLGRVHPSIVDGKTPLQAVMERAGLTSGWESPTVETVLEQRRKELVGEWLRVPDLIRLGQFQEGHERKSNALTSDYTVPWQERFNFLPIPRRELELNRNLQQNDLWR